MHLKFAIALLNIVLKIGIKLFSGFVGFNGTQSVDCCLVQYQQMCEMDAVDWLEWYHIRNRHSNRNREHKVIITKSWYDRKNQSIDEPSVLRYCRTRISIRMFIRWIWFVIFILIYWINNHCIHTDHNFIFRRVGVEPFYRRKKEQNHVNRMWKLFSATS